ncbi:MAG TPA: hypothetical protein VFV98_18265 [Vicinamibacterales bacterium]|nr:hypothetical protein [Vicinamibacterales bacterium]
MFRLLLSALVVSAAMSASTPHGDLWVNVENEKGTAVLGFLPRDKPYGPGVLYAVFEWFDTPAVIDRSGRVISALKFYGWKDGAMTSVVALADVAVEGAKNQVYPYKSPELRTVELARYQLGAGAVQKVDVFSTAFVRTLRMTTR